VAAFLRETGAVDDPCAGRTATRCQENAAAINAASATRQRAIGMANHPYGRLDAGREMRFNVYGRRENLTLAPERIRNFLRCRSRLQQSSVMPSSAIS